MRPGEPTSGVIYAVPDEPLGEHGAPSDAIQGFSFRLRLTRNPENRLPFTRPPDYDPRHYELQRRYSAAGGRSGPQGGALNLRLLTWSVYTVSEAHYTWRIEEGVRLDGLHPEPKGRRNTPSVSSRNSPY